ncbi:MAG: TetM/TetW/TetO/TetS family tetracycline resistance ribosomal protection protein [Oscillospiraceae bacterium]|jgi:ribosomal protection tetracycline resistance protein|nr:TetM/TetW/TetO/TetS family tetracycline resistance ribosomal protection protein [Oscillospiraceae bacterium]
MRFNIAFMAHVDAGKTTLTERILFETGAIRAAGSVDEGTARTDDLAVEKERGISVRAAFTSVTVKDGTVINIIDTPGHADFYAQAERAFLAADALVIPVSAVDGVQAGTELVTGEAGEVPVIYFINKADRETARIGDVVRQLKNLKVGAYRYPEERYETAAELSDELAEAYLSGAPEDRDAVSRVLREHIAERTPILTGSAKTGAGVAELLEAIPRLVPYGGEAGGEPSGVIFSVTHEKMFGRGAAVRLFAGTLRVRDVVVNRGVENKVTVIRRLRNGRWEDIPALAAGEIGMVFGFPRCQTGDTFGEELPPRAMRGLTAKALMTSSVTPDNPAESASLKAAIEMLAAEDPALEPDFGGGAVTVGVMGAIQIETLPALISERFGLGVTLGPPEVVYKETPSKAAVGFDAYTMPKPCWAVLKFIITPGERGSGVSYRCTAGSDRLPYRYRVQVEQSIPQSLKQGPLGWEVTDIGIELVDGEHHHIHTHPLDFTVATPLALADGLRNSGTTLLEPILDITLTFPEKLLGRILGDILRMRGETTGQSYRGDGTVTLTARVPLAASM